MLRIDIVCAVFVSTCALMVGACGRIRYETVKEQSVSLDGSSDAHALDGSRDSGLIDDGSMTLDANRNDAFVMDLDASCSLCDGGPFDVGTVGVDALTDAPADSGFDSGPADSGPADSGPADSGPVDSGPVDSGPADSGPLDSGASGCTVRVLMSRTYEFCSMSRIWDDARADCESRGEDLLRTDSQQENDTVWTNAVTLFPSVVRVHMGGSDQALEGTWRWTDGTIFWQSPNTITYANWRNAEPSNSMGLENCLEMLLTRSGEWNDHRCSDPEPYICRSR